MPSPVTAPYLGVWEIPFLKDGLDCLLFAALHDDQHPLLRLAKHDLVGSHAGLALRDECQINLHAGAGPAGGFASGTSQASGAHILYPGNAAAFEQLETSFQQQVFP